MANWQRYLQSVLRQIGKQLEHNYTAASNFSYSHLESSLLHGELPHVQKLWKLSSTNISRPLHQYLQQLSISSPRMLLASSSEETPVPSPLTPVLAIESGKTDNQKVVAKPSKVQALRKAIKQSVQPPNQSVDYFQIFGL